MTFANVLGFVGRLFIWAGSLLLLFVAYQLWGTGIAEARAQNSLENEFESKLLDAGIDPVVLDGSPDATTTTTTTIADQPSTTTTTTTTTPPPPPDDGEAVAHLVIPKIGVDKIVVEGVTRDDLTRGPGHYPGTPLPGQPGNASIAGHRTTYGQPFHRIDELEPGDLILATTLQGTFRYEVTGQEIVRPGAIEVLEDMGDNRITLTSCHPKYSSRQRIIVTGILVDNPAPAPPPTTAPPVEEPDTDGGGLGPDEETVDDRDDAPGLGDGDLAAGLDSLDGEDERRAGPAIVWGAVVLAVWLAFYLLSVRWRRWPSYALGAPVFGIALLVWFDAITHALPANF